jgi:RHS repeat-associated protein
MIQRSGGQRLGVTRNRQWSVTALHDLANGNVVERYSYDMLGKRTIYAANGTTVRTTSSFGNNFGYTSRWHDEESGLINFRARYYNPLTGEFLRRDPAGFVDGMSLYRGYMELGWMDPTGTVKIACGCRAGGNKGRPIETEVECKGSFETCCKEACRKAGRYVWDGQPSRIVYRPEFARTHDADDIASQNYVPGIGTYFSRYVFAWETPHPADPYDLALTRGKIVIGGAGAATLAVIVGVKAGVVGGTGWALRGAWYYGSHYGRSMMYWGARNPNAAIEIGGGLGGAVGLRMSPDVSGGVTRVGQELLENANSAIHPAFLARFSSLGNDAVETAMHLTPSTNPHIALGLADEGLPGFARQIGAGHLLDFPYDQIQKEFLARAADPGTKFSLSLKGLVGDSPLDQINNSLNNPHGVTDWEIGILNQLGRLSDVDIYDKCGKLLENPFK